MCARHAILVYLHNLWPPAQKPQMNRSSTCRSAGTLFDPLKGGPNGTWPEDPADQISAPWDFFTQGCRVPPTLIYVTQRCSRDLEVHM